MVLNIIVDIIILVGTLLIVLASVGAIRLPDIYLRMHAAAKASSLGLSLLLIGIIIKFPTLSVIMRSAVIVAVIFFTAPLAGHMISRVAYLLKVPKWKGTVKDDLEKVNDDPM
jgi:multicomponent Na+:H+ antiporter subunit G